MRKKPMATGGSRSQRLAAFHRPVRPAAVKEDEAKALDMFNKVGTGVQTAFASPWGRRRKRWFNDAAPGGLAFRFDAAPQECRYRGPGHDRQQAGRRRY